MEDKTQQRPQSHNVFEGSFASDLYRECTQELQEEMGQNGTVPSHNLKVQNRKLVGILYSLSAGDIGEIFPIYLGRNTVGSAVAADVCLRESTVAPTHAVISARKGFGYDGEEEYTLTVSDSRSNYGTRLNGQPVTFEPSALNSNDILEFGHGYTLVLIVFPLDARLKVAQFFDALPPIVEANPNLYRRRPAGAKAAPAGAPATPPVVAAHAAAVARAGARPGIPPAPGAPGAPAAAPAPSAPAAPQPADGQDASKADSRPTAVPPSDPYSRPTRTNGDDHYTNKTIIL